MATINETARINFVTAFDGKGLNAARGSIGALEQLASRAAKTFASLFAAQKVYQFGKASVQAFTEDQKAAAALTQTLGNLGLGFKSLGVEDYIQKLALATGVLDDQLRPAFARLARQTQDIEKTQTLLNLALDVSAGTGQELMTVSNALAKAYGGQYTSLSKLGAGLTKADLATNNFALIQDKLTKLFSGQASTAAETYAGKINRIGVAYDNLKETVGLGLVNAFQSLVGPNGSLDSALTKIQDLGYAISATIQGIGGAFGVLTQVIMSNPLIKILSKPLKGIFGQLVEAGKAAAFAETQKKNTAALELFYKKQKQVAEQTKTQLSLDKAALALKQASKVLDLQQIQIFAAMQEAKGSDLDRLKLQQAILDGNASSAATLAKQVLAANSLMMDLQGNIVADPLKGWVISSQDFLANLQASLDALKGIQSQAATLASTSGSKTPALAAGTVGTTGLTQPQLQSALSTNSFGVSLDSWTQAIQNNPVEVKVTVDPNAVAYGISLATQNQSSNGVSIGTSRNNPIYLNPSSGL